MRGRRTTFGALTSRSLASRLRRISSARETTAGGNPAIALELTDVGTVTDPAEAQRLMGILLSNAALTRAGAAETGKSLLIGLQNGLVLQMSVRDESLMACGTWSCPAFFEAFEAAVQ